MLTYKLYEMQSMLLSATSRKGQSDADLHPSKPRPCFCQQQTGRASQMLTYKLYKMQTMLLSAITRKGQPDANLHPAQNPDHAFVSNKQCEAFTLNFSHS